MGFRKNRTETLVLPPTHILSIRQREAAEALERNSLQELQSVAVLNDSAPNDEQLLGSTSSLPLTPTEGTPSYLDDKATDNKTATQKSKKSRALAKTKQKKTNKNVGAKKNNSKKKKEPSNSTGDDKQ